ncbi:S41 family peptidase [Robertkochia aurantiaca]|uniref:S41 family peptidase n=1 Tax=Robertkochia aurantiaca TaxID=2873700 RepID=UPI001CCF183A|nr:S41 family peptidase [Robertkochia sp. 3YJGBD-33]
MYPKTFLPKLFYLLVFFTLFACTDEDDNIIVPDPALEVEDFIWKGMNYYYFWQQDVAELADNRFENQATYESFLESFADPRELFDRLLFTEDRFSFITDDYQALQESFRGNSDSNGMEFGLVRRSGTDQVFGYVRYIIPGSNAAATSLKRGDLFTAVDGTDLTIDNYLPLLFGDNADYTISLANFEGDNLVKTGETIGLTKMPLSENPVFIAKTLELEGQKIGYLMYNGFIANFEAELNTAFGTFKADGISDLILDLRYNPGGSVNTSTRLASLVTGQFSGQLFAKLRYNNKIEDRLSNSQTEYRFGNSVGGEEANSLNLDRVYVITTSGTASASELVINGLKPYINVIQVGTPTRGKNEASVTVYDSPSFRYNDPGLNPNHTWAIQPIISKTENAAGFGDYADGLQPDISQSEDLRNLGTLGEPDEPLLARTLMSITGASQKFIGTDHQSFELLGESKRNTAWYQRMLLSEL